MEFRKKLIVAATASTLVVSGVVYAGLTPEGPAEIWTIQQIVTLMTKVSATIAEFGASYSLSMSNKFDQIISAVKIATQQEAVSANGVADSIREAGNQLVNSAKIQTLNDAMAQAVMSYHPDTGQGYDPCGTIAKNKTVDLAFKSAAAMARKTITLTDVAPGKLVDSVPKAMQQRLKTHRDKFCSEAEAAAGLCTVSELPGGDVNASLLFESFPANSLQRDARMAYMQHVLGTPDQKLDKSAGGTPAGETFGHNKNRKDAILSVPAYSLAMIDAANTQTEELQGKSPNEALKIRVNQYFGGKEAKAWAGQMARQDQRGLLVEATKMAGLEVWIHHKQYEQNQRIEANLAALLLISADGLSPQLNEKYQKVLADTAKSAIK